ncbi:hypothetical protein HDU67_005840, partial [Dinochytrium kinnereticum]
MDEKDQEEFKALVEYTKGELFKVKWYRVILDEAHTIKNKNTRAAKACTNLHSHYRWCLTGTPFQNHVGDLYSLILFLGIQPYCNWEEFRDDVQMPFKMGRHKKTVDVLRTDFTKEEREFYKSLETQTLLRFNKYLREGTVMKNY